MHALRKLKIVGWVIGALSITSTVQAQGPLEIDELNFGFIKLTDMAPLAVEYEI